ncbi:hypothetical protein [Sphaerotilus sp.]|nr:hypothetical protein [Sphaerotilus sp.]
MKKITQLFSLMTPPVAPPDQTPALEIPIEKIDPAQKNKTQPGAVLGFVA